MKVFIPLPKRIPFTKDGYQAIVDEKKKLLTDRPDAVENLRKAREMGDLSENGYYKASRAKLSTVDARLRHLERLIRYGKIVESANTGFVDIGTTVTINDGAKDSTFTIVGGYESDPKNHTISYLSPIGKAIMGKQKNDTVSVVIPSGVATYTISSIG
ncbi:MAG: transcription elongation factor GreA [Microgenomates group bacterium]